MQVWYLSCGGSPWLLIYIDFVINNLCCQPFSNPSHIALHCIRNIANSGGKLLLGRIGLVHI